MRSIVDRDGLMPPVDLSLREAAGTRVRGGGRSRLRWGWAVLAVAAMLAALAGSGIGGHDVVRPSGLTLVGDFFAAAGHPRLDRPFLTLVAIATLTTLGYAVLGTALSLVIGLAGGVLGSQTWWRGRRRRTRLGGWTLARTVLVLPRGIHEVVWGLFFLSVLGIEPVVAVLAIGIPFGAVTAKVFSEIIDEARQQPYSALLAAGAGRPAALLYGLLPAALPDLLSYGFYRFECAIRSAAILGLVGVGGLGYELQLSFQALKYNEIWTLLYALVLLSAGADLWSSLVRARRLSARPDAGRDRLVLGSLILAGLLVPLSAWWVGLDISALWAGRTWALVAQLASDSWPPRLGADGWTGLVQRSVSTLIMSVIAIAVAFAAGVLLALPAANQLRAGGTPAERGRRVVVAVVTRTILVVLRAIPPPVWALLFLFVLFPGTLPGALALAAYTTGVLGRLMAEAAENLDPRPLVALRAHGASRPQVFCYGVIPAAVPRFVAYGLYRWEVTIRETVVVGVVGAGGLGLLLEQQLGSFDYGGAVGTLATLIVLTLVVDVTSAAVRRSLR